MKIKHLIAESIRCPNVNCQTEYEKIFKKCPNCVTYFESFEYEPVISQDENLESDSDGIDYTKWKSDNLYKHVPVNSECVAHEPFSICYNVNIIQR